MGKKRAGPVDTVIGQTIRVIRLAKHMSQSELAEQIGVTFQQVQKYERGANRVGAGRLIQIAQALGVSLDALLKGVDGADRKPPPGDDPLALLSSGLAMRLAQAFSKISDQRTSVALVRLAEKIASEGRAGRKKK